jgi:hypothetical protein
MAFKTNPLEGRLVFGVASRTISRRLLSTAVEKANSREIDVRNTEAGISSGIITSLYIKGNFVYQFLNKATIKVGSAEVGL